jgi:hypothetical protein
MSCRELNRLIGMAMVEPRFREALLGLRREEVLADFILTPEEKAALLAIQSPTLQGFAQALYHWMSTRNGAIPLPASMVERYLEQRAIAGTDVL